MFSATTATAGAERGEVLIYYANETRPEQDEAASYETIIGWLKSGTQSKHARIAEQLDRDRHLFPAAVDLEVSDLRMEIPSAGVLHGAILVTNQLMRAGTCLVWKAGEAKFAEGPLTVPAAAEMVLKANPLSRTETLASVLDFARRRFDPREHDFVLVTKSHGTKTKALTPRLAVDARETNREELLQVAAADVNQQGLPDWGAHVGITKADFLATLENAGRQHQMHFPLVFLEACHAATPDFDPERLPSNVERLVLIRDDANYINVLYADLLAETSAGERFSDVFVRRLPRKFIVVSRIKPQQNAEMVTSRLLRLSLYFVPLAVWLSWVGWRWRRNRRTRRIGLEDLGTETLRDTIPTRHYSGKIVIVGHTAQRSGEILDLGYLKCIDTHCWDWGWLTALDVEAGTVWQADKEGRVRTTS